MSLPFFTPSKFVTLCQFYSLTLPQLLFTKIHKETIEWEERSFRYVAAYHVISKQVRNNILDTCCINNPDWQSSVITFLGKYNIVVSDTLVGSFLDVLFLLFAVILSGFHEKPSRNRDWITEKNTYKNLCEGHDVLDGTSCFLCDFFCFLGLLPPSSQVTYLLSGPYKYT